MTAFAHATDHKPAGIKRAAQCLKLAIQMLGVDIDPSIKPQAGKMINLAHWLDRAAVMAKQGAD
ncbi:MAG: hypothetical protein EBV03_12715 [Proteobacteria bacterium]|nr:hypothetical protein [Pseudomonadota bacterium]